MYIYTALVCIRVACTYIREHRTRRAFLVVFLVGSLRSASLRFLLCSGPPVVVAWGGGCHCSLRGGWFPCFYAATATTTFATRRRNRYAGLEAQRHQCLRLGRRYVIAPNDLTHPPSSHFHLLSLSVSLLLSVVSSHRIQPSSSQFRRTRICYFDLPTSSHTYTRARTVIYSTTLHYYICVM